MSEKIARRVKHGVKEELLLLVELRGIGRVRARKLFNAGIKRPSDIKDSITKVESLLGKKVADALAKQVQADLSETKNISIKKLLDFENESNPYE